jgi:hypothetical protein
LIATTQISCSAPGTAASISAGPPAAGASVALEALARGTSLGGALPALHGRSILVGNETATYLALFFLVGSAGLLLYRTGNLPLQPLATTENLLLVAWLLVVSIALSVDPAVSARRFVLIDLNHFRNPPPPPSRAPRWRHASRCNDRGCNRLFRSRTMRCA